MLGLQAIPLLMLSWGIVLSLFSGQSVRDVPTYGLLLVANKGDQSLGLIDPGSARQLATIPEGGITGHEVAVSPDGKSAYVPIYGNSGVGRPGTDGRNLVVIDIDTRKIIGNVDFGHGVRPHCAVFGPKNGLLYVTTELDNSVSVIDPHTFKILFSIPTGQAESHMLAITRDGRRGYTANVGPGTVSVLDLEARKTVAVVPISRETQRISLSIDDSMAFTADQTHPQLAVIDTSANKVKAWVPLPASGYGTAPTRDGRWLLVAVPGANQVVVVDLLTLKVARSINVPSAPQEVLVRPDNQVAYVACDVSHKIAVVNLTAWSVEKLIDAGKLADGLAWASLK
jgi:YVTN family beta-propeller protein